MFPVIVWRGESKHREEVQSQLAKTAESVLELVWLLKLRKSETISGLKCISKLMPCFGFDIALSGSRIA